MTEPAFPAMHYDLAEGEHGLTMRDYFAAKAMTGLIAAEIIGSDDHVAETAYAIADAMMEVRKQK